MQRVDNSVGLQKITLKELTPDIDNALIIVIIIAKQQPRIFQDARADTNKVRAVWNFTLRDSVQDYINATYWGPSECILPLNDKFQIGDVVAILKPKIEIRSINDYGEQFRPMVTSPYTLILNENSQIISQDVNNFHSYLKLMHFPTKPLAKFVTLADAHNTQRYKQNALIDLLGAVRSVGQIRNIKTKDGRESQVREVVIFDHTSPGFRFTIWDIELIIRAGNWKARTTILFLTDMRAEWSNFHRSIVGSLSARTVVTEDPVGAEADTLKNFAKTAPIQPSAILDQMSTSIIDPNTIQNVMNIRQVLNKIDSLPTFQINCANDQQFTALVYAFVTCLDIDGTSRVVTTRCSVCNNLLLNTISTCQNLECPVGNGTENKEPVTNFDLRVLLTDHTGSIENCRLTNKAAENVLGCEVEEFLLMNDEQKNKLKWKYLLERCAIRIMVLCVNGRRPLISILSCTVASPTAAANHLSVY